MEQWWKRNKVKLGNYTEDEVEDFTGCIPLLLEKCVEGGEINLKVPAMQTVWDQASTFVDEIQAKRNDVYWNRYVHLSLNFKASLTSIDIVST